MSAIIPVPTKRSLLSRIVRFFKIANARHEYVTAEAYVIKMRNLGGLDDEELALWDEFLADCRLRIEILEMT